VAVAWHDLHARSMAAATLPIVSTLCLKADVCLYAHQMAV
jgi:hypothetical protein